MANGDCRFEVRRAPGRTVRIESVSPRGWRDAVAHAEKLTREDAAAQTRRWVDTSVNMTCMDGKRTRGVINLLHCRNNVCKASAPDTDDRRALAGVDQRFMDAGGYWIVVALAAGVVGWLAWKRR